MLEVELEMSVLQESETVLSELRWRSITTMADEGCTRSPRSGDPEDWKRDDGDQLGDQR